MMIVFSFIFVADTKIIFGYNFATTLMKIKARLKMKNKSQLYDINRLRPRDGHKYAKCKMYLSIIIVICINQHINIIRSSTDEKLKQH